MLPQDDKPDNNDEALCPSVPKCGSIVIVLSADDPSTFGSALKKLESEYQLFTDHLNRWTKLKIDRYEYGLA